MNTEIIVPLTAFERFMETNAALECFLMNHRQAIKASHREQITKHFDRMLAGHVEPFAPDKLPGYLHDEFLRLACQERYKAVNAGKNFDEKQSYLP